MKIIIITYLIATPSLVQLHWIIITVVLGRQKNKIKTKLKEKQISHNVNIHCVSPCDSLPPSGEHALSPSSVRGAVWCKIRVECGFSLSLRVSLPLWVLGVGETSGSSFSRTAEGLFR